MIEFAEDENGRMIDFSPLRELSVAGRDILYKYGLSNENPDDLIARKGMTYIEEIERDTHLSSQLKLRRQKLIKKGYKILPAEKNGKITARNQMIADFVRWNLEGMTGSFKKDIEAMLDATSKGFSITEINYKILSGGPYAGKLGLAHLRFKPAKYFSFLFDVFGHYIINQIDPDINGVALPKEKFIHLISGPNDENPYGQGVTSKCAFWVWLKKNQAKFWAIFNERFGMPLTRVEIPRNAKAEEETKAEEIIEDLQTHAGIKIPEGFGVDFLEATRSGDITYDNFIERCNKEISKEVIGATLTTEEGSRGQGSYAHSSTHAGILEDFIVFDAAITEEAINEQLIRRLVNWNFDTDVYPRFVWEGVDVTRLISLAQAFAELAKSGLKIPHSYVHEKTGIPIPLDGEPVLAPVAQGSAGNPVGLDNRSFKDFGFRISDFGFKDIENFQEWPEELQEEVREVDRLKERFVKLMAERTETALRRMEEKLKKKAD